ncbi:MAG: phage tail protein [Pseudomonadota bacterium]
MSQHDLTLDNAAGAAFRADANNAIAALASVSSGASAPATTVAYQFWADTTAGLLKQRNAANSAWIIRGSLSESRVITRSTNTALGVSDFGRMITATSSFTQTFNAAATLGDGWYAFYRVEVGVTVVFDPNSSELIDGGSTRTVIGPSSGLVFSDGTGLRTIGFPVDSVTPGTVIHVGAATAPAGYLKANGAAVSRSTYAALFAVIGTNFGAGDGSTTFNLPDLRGEFVRGWDDGRGVDTGRVIGSSQGDSFAAHSHPGSLAFTASAGTHSHLNGYSGSGSDDGGAYSILGTTGSNDTPASTGSAGAHTHDISLAVATQGGTETRPRSLALLACIKF